MVQVAKNVTFRLCLVAGRNHDPPDLVQYSANCTTNLIAEGTGKGSAFTRMVMLMKIMVYSRSITHLQ